MRKKMIRVAAGSLLSLALAAGSFGGQYKVVGEKGDFYFGHISYVDTRAGGNPPVVFRIGAAFPETAVLNLPLGPGDSVQTPAGGRCEIQFDNGTIVRLDTNTALKIETILAPSLSTARKMTNLLIPQGRVYVMYKEHGPQEIFQVIMPSASVKLSDSAVALIEAAGGQSAVQVEKGRAEVLYGKDKDHAAEMRTSAGERVVVGADNSARTAEYAAVSEFKTWNEKINADFPALHEGNALPKPLQKLPPAVFEFAQKFGNLHGEWLWHDLFGYVWRPYLNDLRYPWGTWQPYFYGDWTDYNGQLYWVPGEPWGWVPYHLGLWMWDEKSGWVWMPGSLFAPAWVDWEFFSGHYFWRPFTLFDYYEGWDSDVFLWGYLNPGFGPTVPGGTDPADPHRSTPVRTIVTKDGLKKKSRPPLPVPKEMRGALQAAAEAMKRGDAWVQASLRGTLRRPVIVSKAEFGKPGWQDKIVSLDRFPVRPRVDVAAPGRPAGVPSQFVARDALRRYEAVRIAGEVGAAIDAARPAVIDKITRADFGFGRERRAARPDALIQDVGRAGAPAPPNIRFRDWNPDVRAAVRMGVDIDYSSRTNEVYSSQLGRRSRDGGPRSRMWTQDGSFGGPAPDSGPGLGAAPSTPGQPGSGSTTGTSVSKGSLKEKNGEKKD